MNAIAAYGNVMTTNVFSSGILNNVLITPAFVAELWLYVKFCIAEYGGERIFLILFYKISFKMKYVEV